MMIAVAYGWSVLHGYVDWPADRASRYRNAGLWEGVTVAEMVERIARRSPKKTAVVSGAQRTTYEALVTLSKELAVGFLRLGIAPRDRVVVQLPNTLEFISCYLALN